MENYPLTQLIQALSSLFWGAVLGLTYDLLRAVRRVLHRGTGMADLLFCLCALGSLFYLGMSLGQGQLRIFMGLFAALGLGLYLGCITPFVLPPMIILVKKLCFPLYLVKKGAKKVHIFLKKYFQSLLKWVRIKLEIGRHPARENPRETTLFGEEHLHGTQNRYDRKTASAHSGFLRADKPHLPDGRHDKRGKHQRRASERGQ